VIEINGALANQGGNSNIAAVQQSSRRNGGETNEIITMVAFSSREQSEGFDPERKVFMPQRIKGKIQPRGGLVVVRQHEKTDDVTEGGIMIPGNVGMAGIIFATVMEVGPGRLIDSGARVEIELQKGDTVMIKSDRAMPLSIEDRDIFLINETDILARIIE